MASIPLATLNPQGFSSAASSSNAPPEPPEDTRSAGAADVSPADTPEYSPGPSLQRQQRQQHMQQQVQQRHSQERRRLPTQAITQEPHETVLQLLTQPQQQSPSPALLSQRNHNGNGILRLLWSTVVKERGFEISIFALILGIVMVAPTFGQYATGVWSSAKDYQGWCKDEQSANHTLTRVCGMIVDMPLPPPPGLNQVFKDIGRREPVVVVVPKAPSPLPVWKRATDEEREMMQAFVRGPVGNGMSLVFFGFFVLMIPLENPELKWPLFALVLSFFNITRKASLIFALRNVSVLMDWAFWLRKVNVKGPSWASIAVLPVLYAVGYMNEKSMTTQIALAIISALVVGDHYSHKLLPLYHFLGHLGYGD